jgi:hypothetical protein
MPSVNVHAPNYAWDFQHGARHGSMYDAALKTWYSSCIALASGGIKHGAGHATQHDHLLETWFVTCMPLCLYYISKASVQLETYCAQQRIDQIPTNE